MLGLIIVSNGSAMGSRVPVHDMRLVGA